MDCDIFPTLTLRRPLPTKVQMPVFSRFQGEAVDFVKIGFDNV